MGATTTDFVLDASMFVREMQGGTAKATYFVGARGPEYRRDDTTGNVRWYIFDGLGSVLGEVDPNGSLTANRTYDVYGTVRSSAGTSTSKHKFVGNLGHPSDDNTGLVYMRSRHMDPVTGRFENEDPAKQGCNWLAYCGNNPVNFVDPTGKEDTLIGCMIAGAIQGMLTSIITQLFFTGKVDIEKVIIGALFGAVAGAIGFAAGAAVGQILPKGAEAWMMNSNTQILLWFLTNPGLGVTKAAGCGLALLGYALVREAFVYVILDMDERLGIER